MSRRALALYGAGAIVAAVASPHGCLLIKLCRSKELTPKVVERTEYVSVRRPTMNKRVLTIAILIMFQLCPGMGAAILKPETKAAWDGYLQATNAAMQERLQPGGPFPLG